MTSQPIKNEPLPLFVNRREKYQQTSENIRQVLVLANLSSKDMITLIHARDVLDKLIANEK